MKRFIPLLIFIAAIVGGIKAYNYFSPKNPVKIPEKTTTELTETLTPVPTGVQSTDVKRVDTKNPNTMMIDQNKTYQAIIKTSVGDITIDLIADKTPITVNNFVSLAKKDFYSNTIFHRVIKGFMIQGGDPKGDGTGGPGYKFDDEPFTGEYVRGTVAMANSGPNTNGSQFFIMQADNPLPKNYVIFGKVSEGLDTVDKIAGAPVKANPYSGEESVPVVPVSVKSVEIVEK
jgi:cyclophilin family peptidyl-prolyl cis-trans isomerase